MASKVRKRKPKLSFVDIVTRADIDVIKKAYEARLEIEELLRQRYEAYQKIATLEAKIEEIVGETGVFEYPPAPYPVAPPTFVVKSMLKTISTASISGPESSREIAKKNEPAASPPTPEGQNVHSRDQNAHKGRATLEPSPDTGGGANVEDSGVPAATALDTAPTNSLTESATESTASSDTVDSSRKKKFAVKNERKAKK